MGEGYGRGEEERIRWGRKGMLMNTLRFHVVNVIESIFV